MRKAPVIGIMLIALIVVSGCASSNIATMNNKGATCQDMEVKEFSLATQDGIAISVTHLRCGQPNVCILAHGFMGSKHRPYITELAERLSASLDVITFDFRGHGASGGTCNGMKETYDIRAVIDYAKKSGYEKIALVGFSLGGIEGIYEVAKSHDVDALVTVGTPADAEAIRPNAGWLFWMASNGLGKLILRIWVRLDSAPEFPRPVVAIGQVSPVPILIVHGSGDTLVNVKEAEILYEKAKEPKELVVIEGMNHPPYLPKEFYDIVENWLIGVLKQ